MFWVCCCGCFVRPSQSPQRKFYMSSCSHIYCERCVSSTNPYCRRCCVSIKLVGCDSQMPSEVRDVFCDANSKASALVKAMEYQAGQRYGLMSHLRAAEGKYNAAKSFIKDAEVKNANMKQQLESTLRKIKELELANESLKKQILKIRQSPLPSPPASNQWFTNLNLTHSSSRRSSVATPTAPFTPRNCYSHYTESPMNTPFPTKTPTLSNESTSSRHSSNRSVPGFTPPQKTLELLMLLNKKREHNHL